MPICRTCGGEFDWGDLGDGKWALLQPIGLDRGMDRRYVDEDGVPRADHRDLHPHAGRTVAVTRLEQRIKAEDIDEPEPEEPERKRRRMPRIPRVFGGERAYDDMSPEWTT